MCHTHERETTAGIFEHPQLPPPRKLLERNDICGGCEGQVPEAGYVAAFLAFLGSVPFAPFLPPPHTHTHSHTHGWLNRREMIAVVVYKETFPFKDIFIAVPARRPLSLFGLSRRAQTHTQPTHTYRRALDLISTSVITSWLFHVRLSLFP